MNMANAVRMLSGVVFAVALIALQTVGGPVEAQTLPQYGDSPHLGVASCAGSTCHGAVEPWKNSTVLQNEYVIWQKNDRHARAYSVLLNERSKRIARNLGLENAHTAKICLDCHADNVAQNKRSKTFQISDGVGCEACHGGAASWLGIHVSGLASHAENVAAGLYPTEEPVARAKLCLSCHFGIEQKFVTHRIMGAGHPRMSFELDTFTAIQPAHYRADKDYYERKQVVNGVKTWAIGQALAMSELLEAMISDSRGTDGVFPELVLFDCHACHHRMSNLRWEPRASVGLQPGIPRINDANLVMLRVILDQIDPELGKDLTAKSLALHQASTKGRDALVSAAKDLKAVTDKLVGSFAAHNFAKKDMQALLTAVVETGLQQREYIDYSAAEQATMAISSVMSAMRSAGFIDKGQFDQMTSALDKAYEATAKDDDYTPDAFISALQTFKDAMPKS